MPRVPAVSVGDRAVHGWNPAGYAALLGVPYSGEQPLPPRELAQGPSKAFGAAKRLFHQSTWESLETQMELEAQAIAASGRTEDFRAGVTAFADKKPPPAFRGR